MTQRLPTLLLLGLSLLATSCFHKSVMNDEADDVKANFIYKGPEGTFLISWEEVFQATSKESGGGVTHISGYTERRLSSYDINTGELKARVELGDMIDDAVEPLGYSPGKIWMYSIDEELGLHYLNPATLQIGEAWPQIAPKTGVAGIQLAKPDWPLINSHFAFDWKEGKVMITDMSGYHYHLDPATLKLVKTDEDLPRVNWEPGAFSSSGEMRRDVYFSLDGDTRKQISFDSRKSGPDVSFLQGEYILDQDPIRKSEGVKQELAVFNAKVKELQDSLTRYEAAHPEATQKPDYSTWNYDKREIHDKAVNIRYALEAAQRDLSHFMTFGADGLSSPLMSTDGKSVYLTSASSMADTARMVVSRADMQPDTTWKVSWTTHISSLYHNYSKADAAGAFETVFSKGNPSYDYTWAGTDGKHLILVGQLHILCLDLATGKILWDKRV